MRPNSRVDQAEGLRRLLARPGEAQNLDAGLPASYPAEPHQAEIIMVVAGKPGVGCTSATINLAAALAQLGKKVMVLDENGGSSDRLHGHGLPARHDLPAQHDLLDVVQGRCTLSEATLTTNGFSMLCAARVMSKFSRLNQNEQQRLHETLIEVSDGMDVLLVDSATPAPIRSMRSGQNAHGGIEGLIGQISISANLASKAVLLVVADATASGITESYALIKRLSLENVNLHFEIMMNKVSDEQAAMAVFGNMAKVARHNLTTRLGYFGCVPVDDRLKRATKSGRSVVEFFPAAVSAKSYFGLAQKICKENKIRQHIGEISFVVN